MSVGSGETSRRARSDGLLETFVLITLGGAAGLSVLLLPSTAQPAVSTSVMYAALLTNLAALLSEWRQRRRARDGAASPDVSTTLSLLHRPGVRRTDAVVLGVVLAQVGLILDSGVLGVAVVVVGAVATAALGPLVRRSHRRQLAAARAAHPGEAVVLVALVDLATMRLAQWAKAARVSLPADLGRAGVLTADVRGVALHRSGRPDRLVHRWAWDDVELATAPHPEDPEAAALSLTLLGPRPVERRRAVPVGRRRFAVTLAVRDGALPAPHDVVDGAVDHLTASRSGASTGAADTSPGVAASTVGYN